MGRLKGSSAALWREAFDSAFDEGRFEAASRIFDERAGRSETAETVLRAAHAHLHADPAQVLRLLLGLRVPGTKPAALVEREVLLAEAFARTRDFESADARLAAALEIGQATGDPELIGMVGYRRVRRYLQAEDAPAARQAMELTRQAVSPLGRLYSLYAETLILPYEERVREQAERLIELLRLLDPNEASFVDVRAWATHALSILTRELHIPHALPEVQRQLGGLGWPTDFAPNRFQALKALGWAKALQGDYFNAFRHLKAASELKDVSAAWHVVAACDRAYLARCFDEHRWSRVELDEAEQLAARVDWHSTLSEERIGLLLLAELFSGVDTAGSAMYLARYRELGEIKSPLHYRRDARLRAFAQFSTGIVEIALGNKRRGLTELRAARKVFERFGYDFRTARCLAAEYEATHNRDLLPSLEEKLRNYGHSWLAAGICGFGRSSARSLPPMRKRVLDEVCQGKSTAEISRALGRSKFTISNHIKELFKTFEVKSRSALVAEAVRRKI
ncbi:MAG TPA: helix-turn-helix domain-containing protein [Candidatus Cybelea sp.]